ncbi:MAG: MGMT family protein [Candidatus Omnitrophica bacterium]|nr:MGMT family protein [Candidatus Omnitrophota bacterium]
MKPKKTFTQPLRIWEGLTPFQVKVFEAVKKIPKGEVRSYDWIARKVAHPRAYRAVGNALNRNPYPVVIPCHRVVRANGSLGGFSKGSKEKLRLLKAEGLTPKMIRDIIKKSSR